MRKLFAKKKIGSSRSSQSTGFFSSIEGRKDMNELLIVAHAHNGKNS